MLGMASGKSLIEEGGLLVGICQASKAFLVLSGISLGLWIVIMITSCAAMATGVGSKKNQEKGSERSERSSIRSALSRLRRHGINTQLPMPATYPDPKAPVHPISQTPPGLVYPPQASRDQPVRPVEPRIEKRHVAYARPLQSPAQAKTQGAQCPPNCTFHSAMYQPQYAKTPVSGPPRQPRDLPVGPATAPRASNINSAYASDGYSQDTSPRPTPPHHAQYTSHSPPKPPTNPIDDDSRELGHDANDHYEHDKNSAYAAQYSPDDGHEYEEYMHHHSIPPHPHSPESNPSRRNRLRQIFTRDTTEHS
ncbi:hypothetical protein GGH96_001925 [Coemansia sp. RSA 1972]|nr:hypothetical protein GGH96_001925 [Coemansia sp. RSA 1972]